MQLAFVLVAGEKLLLLGVEEPHHIPLDKDTVLRLGDMTPTHLSCARTRLQQSKRSSKPGEGHCARAQGTLLSAMPSLLHSCKSLLWASPSQAVKRGKPTVLQPGSGRRVRSPMCLRH